MTREGWKAIYTRKSRALDGLADEAELFRKHRDSLFRQAGLLGLAVPAERYFQEVGSSESVEARPVFSALLEEVDQLAYRAGGHLIVMDQDRISRAEMGELGLILARFRRAGIIIHQVLGGDLDLTDHRQYGMASLKGVVAHMIIEDYKAKQADAWAFMRRNGERRQGPPPFGYWLDKTEERSRDRLKADTREGQRDRTGYTPWEKLCRCCAEVLTTSVAQLAERYAVPETTLFSTLATPTIAGYPVTRYEKNPEPKGKGDHYRRLPPDRWLWPERPGSYPAACTLDQWYAIQEAIDARKDGKVKTNQGEGVCRDVVRFVGMEGPVVLARRHDKAATPVYRQTPCGRRDSCGQRDVERHRVDQHASLAIRELVKEPGFFPWALGEYYRERKAAEPEDTDRQMQTLNRQLGQWRQAADKARQWGYAAESEAEAAGYRQDHKNFLSLIEGAEAQKAALARARSPIPAVDRAVPFLLALVAECDPAVWAEEWPAIWGRLSAAGRTLWVKMCIETIPVAYAPPSGPVRGCYRGQATRTLLPVVYTPFIRAAREAYALTPTRSASSRKSRPCGGELWRELVALWEGLALRLPTAA